MPILQGQFVDLEGVWVGQVRVEQGVIVETGKNLGQPDWDFSADCLAFAGFGDLHVHARQDVTGQHNYKETFASAAAAALHGGVTYFAEMPNNPQPPIDQERHQAKQALTSKVPHQFPILCYAGIGPGTKPFSQRVPYKAYMGPSVGELFFQDNDTLEATIAHYRGHDVSFHCEDPELLAQHQTAASHEARRPPECEAAAVRFALELIERYELHGKICHLSLGSLVPEIRSARQRGVQVAIEATPHHLYFDQSHLTDTNRLWLQMNPPLRSPEERELLLAAFRQGNIDFLATDHAPHSKEEKQAGHSGVTHLDTFGPFVAWLLKQAGVAPERVAATCAANPGSWFRRFWSQDMFGRIQPGYSGTFTLLDCQCPITIAEANLQTACGWSPFTGITFPGQVAAVWLRGELVHQNPLQTIASTPPHTATSQAD